MILITGGCGYLGSHCAVELINAGYEVVILDNLSNSDISIIENINLLTNNKNIFEKIDIRSKPSLSNLFKKYNFKAVFHFAGLKSIVDSIENPIMYYNNNIIGTISLLSSMEDASVNKFIFSSSATVYGDKFIPPWNEGMEIQMPSNPYAQTKFIIECILCNIAKKNNEFSIGNLRYFNPIGAHESGRIGENIKNSSNLIPSILNSLSNDNAIKIYGNDYDTPDGTAIRDYVHVNDLIKGHLKAFQYINKKKGYNVWNLGSGTGYSVKQVIQTFEKLLDKKFNIKYLQRRVGDLPQYWADISKAENELNWKAKYDLERMISDSVRYFNL